MFGHKPRLRRGRVGMACAAIIIAAAGLAACSSNNGAPPGTSSGTKISGGTVTYGLPPNTTINYIFPFMSITTSSVYNSNQFQYLLYRPLYMFGGNSASDVDINYTLSPADAPVYSDGGKTVTMDLKGWKWSNGETVDAKDVIFWMNLMEAEKANWYGYTPGLFPDNVTSYAATGPEQVVLHLNQAYSSYWFTYGELPQITPIPMAWDVTSLGAAAGSGGCTTDTAADKWAKCAAVYNFLTAQAKNSSTYASSSLWSVVDGPFKLSYFNSNGNVTIVPNASYSGAQKPTIAALKYVPFTSDATTYTALKTGQLDIAQQVPWSDLPPRSAGAAVPTTNPLGSSYYLEPFYSYGINYVQPNFNGPTRYMVRQLYIRQALQELVDQVGMVDAIWHGYAYPTAGPVPNEPVTQWEAPAQKDNGGQGTYAFDISAAKTLLTSHGWSEVGGIMTCETPSLCGTGITKGTQMKFTFYYSSGMTEFDNEMAVYKSDASEAGVDLTTIAQSFDTVIGESTPCTPGPKCNWDGLMYGGWVFNGPGFIPTGEALFETGSGSNSGSYSDSTEDGLINATHTSSSLPSFDQYVTYTMQQAPYIWMPNYYYVVAVTSTLKNVAMNPLWTLEPEYWYFTK
jgi:peptide/nickel transport system substrate-binding protein